jgi:hypothetical protein
MLPPSMALFNDVSATDFFLVPSPEPVPNNEETPLNNTVTEEDHSYYFKDAIFLVRKSYFVDQLSI